MLNAPEDKLIFEAYAKSKKPIKDKDKVENALTCPDCGCARIKQTNNLKDCECLDCGHKFKR